MNHFRGCFSLNNYLENSSTMFASAPVYIILLEYVYFRSKIASRYKYMIIKECIKGEEDE